MPEDFKVPAMPEGYEFFVTDRSPRWVSYGWRRTIPEGLEIHLGFAHPLDCAASAWKHYAMWRGTKLDAN